MELKTKLEYPYTFEQKRDFIFTQNHQNGYEIKFVEREIVDEETEEAITIVTDLEAWGYTNEEIEEQEKERIAKLSLTRGDVFRGILQAKGIVKAQIRAIIENMEESLQKEMALIDFDDALNFYRGNPLIDTLGTTLGITPQQLDRFFETNDYHELINEEN